MIPATTKISGVVSSRLTFYRARITHARVLPDVDLLYLRHSTNGASSSYAAVAPDVHGR